MTPNVGTSNSINGKEKLPLYQCPPRRIEAALGIPNGGNLNRELVIKILKCVEEQKGQFDHNKPYIIGAPEWLSG